MKFKRNLVQSVSLSHFRFTASQIHQLLIFQKPNLRNFKFGLQSKNKYLSCLSAKQTALIKGQFYSEHEIDEEIQL